MIDSKKIEVNEEVRFNFYHEQFEYRNNYKISCFYIKKVFIKNKKLNETETIIPKFNKENLNFNPKGKQPNIKTGRNLKFHLNSISKSKNSQNLFHKDKIYFPKKNLSSITKICWIIFLILLILLIIDILGFFLA